MQVTLSQEMQAPPPVEESEIVLPFIKIEPPKPDPVVVPEVRTVEVDKLAVDEWYVIQSNTELFVLASPVGIVDVTYDPGPLRLKGKFAGSTGQIETKVFDRPHIYSVSAVKSGTVELIIVPVGATEAKSVVRRTVIVSGSGPQPPPTPTPDPVPVPVPSSGFRVLMLTNEDMTREQNITVYSTTLRAWLKENCEKNAEGLPEFRVWDRTTVAQPGMITAESKAWQDLYGAVKDRVAGRNVVVVQSGTNVWLSDLGSIETVMGWLKAKKEGR